MPIAINDKGEAIFLTDDGAWEPAKTAVNPETGKTVAFDGKAWEPIELPKPKDPRPYSERPWGEIRGEMLSNVPESALRLGKSIVEPILSPVETAKNLWKAAATEEGRAGVGKFFKDRYGGIDQFSETLVKDPVGLLADASTVLTGGGLAATRAPGVVGQVGKAAMAAGRATDPVTLAAKGVAGVAKATEPVISSALGTTTGAGTEAIRQASRAGAEGGAKADAFLENLRGNVPVESVVQDAKRAVDQMRIDRGNAYRSGMANISLDKTVIDFSLVDQAVRDVAKIGVFKGKVLDRSAADVWQKIENVVDEWRQSDPAVFHTPEGMDALKKAVGDIRDNIPYGTPSRSVADRVYGAIRGQIVKQAPTYGKVMKDYESASDLLKQMEKTLSINPKANVDTTLRKLQSVLRSNVNTNYGQRGKLVNELEGTSPNLRASIAGQTLSDFAPRGLARLTGGATMVGGVGLNPALLAALPMQSPRLVGEAAYYGGKGSAMLRNPNVASAIPPTGMSLYQLGRLNELYGKD